MALSAADSVATFDNTKKHLDISPVLASIILNDNAFLGLIGMGPAVKGAIHYFNEDSLNPPTVTINELGGLSVGDTTLTLDDATKIAVGTILMDMAVGTQELLQVTAISGNDCTVTRGYGGTTAETHADDAVFAIVGQPKQEGDETINDVSKARTQVTQYCEIFKKTVKVSGTAEAEANNGLHPGIASEVKLQMLRRTDEIHVEMNRAALNSYLSAAGSDSVYRTLMGLRQYLNQTGANKTVTAEALSEKVVNTMYGNCFDDGGKPNALIGAAAQITVFSDFNKSKVRTSPSDRVSGNYVDRFMTSYGAELRLVIDRWFKTDEIAMLESGKCRWAPLQGRALFAEALAKVGDALRWQIVGEGTLIVENATQAHAYHTNLTVPA